MDFGRYLFLTQRLTKDEYVGLLTKQLNKSLTNAPRDRATGFVATHLNGVSNLGPIRECPFGDILQESTIRKEVFKRARKDLPALIDEWHEWHRDQLEPICTYSLVSDFGQQLYARESHKKLTARFIADGRVRNGDTIIHDDETVVIPEGTSGLYVGLAIAALRRSVTIYTSNFGLVREYRDNPAIARHLGPLHVIGGEADFDNTLSRSEFCSVHGPACYSQYEEAIRDAPPATIVVVTVSGLTAEEGPFVAGPTGPIKAVMIRHALDSPQVREVVFVADYRKHLRKSIGPKAPPIFPADTWEGIVKQHRQRIRIVTTPPPALAAALAFGQGRDVLRRDLREIHGPKKFSAQDSEYARAAKGLYNIAGISQRRTARAVSMFHEVFDPVIDKSLSVFILEQPYDTFKLDLFASYVASLISQDLSAYRLRAEECDRGTVVVAVWDKKPHDSIVSRCQRKSRAVADFMDGTRATEIELYFEGRRELIELKKLP